VKLTLTSATAALKAATGGLLLAAALMPPGARAQNNGGHTVRSKPTHTFPQLSGELQRRQRALDSARLGDDPAAIARASGLLIAAALRNFAALQLVRVEASTAVETCRRSVDFEDLPEARVELALAYLYAGHSDQALNQVTDVLVADPANGLAWRVQGQVWMAKGNYGEAAASLRKSLAVQPAAPTRRLLRAALAGGGGDKPWRSVPPELLPEGGGNSAAMLRLRDILGGALNDLGAAEARQQQFALALAHFHEAERWQAHTPGLMRNIGLAASRAGDYAEAARALAPVVAADPKDTVARSLLGMALFSTGSYQEAARVLGLLGEAAFERPELAYAWAESVIKLNRFEEAGVLLTKLEASGAGGATQMLAAQAWSEMGNYPRTVAACRRALQADPSLAQAHYLAGMALIHEDRPGEAAGEFRAQLQRDPDNTNAEYHLAFVLFQLSRDQEALQLLRRVLARDPEHPDANYELGKALLTAGKTAEAIPYLESAARLKPGLDAVHYQLQSAYRSVGRKADAAREANIYRAMKAKSRNITLPPPRPGQSQ
jgi:tetratricopeptide (TPR) repeat protein